MIQHLSPASGESFDVLFARKLQKADGSLSDVFVINANLMALLHYYVDCFFDASAPFRRDKKKNFKTKKNHLINKKETNKNSKWKKRPKRMKMKNSKLQVFLIYTNLNLQQAKRKAVVKSQFKRNKTWKSKMKNIKKMKT